ncbi:MAG TPA: NAD(P)-binding domain-containing protein, partial [Terriglobales bacterium]|nr:NAD(P)-binding domain-containing protein [Terriglobales bacterium]
MAPRAKNRPTIAIVGAGSLGTALSLSLANTRYRVDEIVCRSLAASCRRASTLARRIGARVVVLGREELRANVVWLCVPDRDIAACA